MWHYTDGTNTHGPIDEAALRGMLLHGTVNRNTLIWREGMSEWKSYGSIFVESQPQASSRGNGGTGGNDRAYALDRVKGPAIFMIVNAALTIVGSLVQLLINLGVFSIGALGDLSKNDQAQMVLQGAGGVIGAVVSVIFAIVVLVGALKMKGLTSYGFAMTAAIMGILCTNVCCCPVGLGAGIWALVVLNDPKVKAAF
ncbi:MAG: DUF4339 domain-containing protein [Pedosphaera sp.]|nr:DUF4339 domain-containing protein [Pedosphaera sp.]